MHPEGALWTDLARVADIATLVALPVALVGLFLALSQLKRTRKAVEAAARAQRQAERDSALRQLLVLLPSLGEIEQALDNAVAQEDHNGARRELAGWRLRAGEVQGMLAGQMDLPSNLQEELAKAIVQASAAKQRLLDEEVDIVQATERARADIANSVDGLTELAGRFKAYVGEEENESE